MGTPEFLDLGKHCSVEECRQIDFLVFTCEGCKKVLLNHPSLSPLFDCLMLEKIRIDYGISSHIGWNLGY